MAVALAGRGPGEFAGGFNPLVNDADDFLQRFPAGPAVRHAARKIRRLGWGIRNGERGMRLKLQTPNLSSPRSFGRTKLFRGGVQGRIEEGTKCSMGSYLVMTFLGLTLM